MTVADWIESFRNNDCTRYVKRLSHNDVGDNRNHQAGPYIAKNALKNGIPGINNRDIRDPDDWILMIVDSHNQRGRVRAVWYNGLLHEESTRNEARLTNLSEVPVFLEHGSYGRIVLFAFLPDPASNQTVCHAWVCAKDEETVVERSIGPVIQGHPRTWE